MSDDTCPRCKNPILDGDCVISRQGLTFHAGCGEGSLAWPVIIESLHARIAALEHWHAEQEELTSRLKALRPDIAERLDEIAKPVEINDHKPVADDAQVICPGCSHQFPAISVNHQQNIAARARVAELEGLLREVDDDANAYNNHHAGLPPDEYRELLRRIHAALAAGKDTKCS